MHPGAQESRGRYSQKASTPLHWHKRPGEPCCPRPSEAPGVGSGNSRAAPERVGSVPASKGGPPQAPERSRGDTKEDPRRRLKDTKPRSSWAPCCPHWVSVTCSYKSPPSSDPQCLLQWKPVAAAPPQRLFGGSKKATHSPGQGPETGCLQQVDPEQKSPAHPDSRNQSLLKKENHSVGQECGKAGTSHGRPGRKMAQLPWNTAWKFL